MEQFLEEQEKIAQTVYWINRLGEEEPLTGSIRDSDSVNTAGLQLVLKHNLANGNLLWMLLVKLDEEAFENYCSGYVELGYHVIILNGSEVLLETSPDFTGAYLEQKGNANLFKGNSGATYKMSVVRKGVSGLTYVTGYDTAMTRRYATVFVWVSFGVIAAFAVLLLAVRLSAVAFTKPIRKLQFFIDDQNNRIKELLVGHLLKGELEQEKIRDSLEKSGISPCAAYRMIVVRNKDGSDNDTNSKLSHEALNRLPGEIRREIFILPVCFEENMVFLTGAEDDIAVDNKTTHLYKEIKTFMEQDMGIVTASGISQTFHKLHHVRRAYKECNEALHNRLNTEDTKNSSLVLFEDYRTLSGGGNVYDKIMETECIAAVESCKEEEAVRLLELIVERMEWKEVVGIERDLYLIRLTSAMLNIPIAAEIPLSDVFDSEQYNVLNRITQIYGKKEVVNYIHTEVIRPIIRKMLEVRQEGEGLEMIRQVMNLIKESNGLITLNECAERMNYHPNYLSKVLKREKGMSFTDIVNEEKLKQAKYMLLTTEYTIAEISEKLDYNNVQNFIRFFKNHVDFTPAAFRKEHRK